MCNNFKINTCDETNIFWPWVWTLFTQYTNDENDGYLDCIFVYRSVIMMKWLIADDCGYMDCIPTMKQLGIWQLML